jgi:D-alanyl-D-alanine carboxypeptidase
VTAIEFWTGGRRVFRYAVGKPARAAAFLFLFLTLFAAALPGQEAGPPEALPAASETTREQACDPPSIGALQDRIRVRLEAFREKTGCPGVSAAFVLADGSEGAVAVGWADVEEKKPLTPRDRILSGSIGKTYVSAVAMQLVGENRLDLDKKISVYLGKERWFGRLPNGSDVTVRMLMNHTSGVPEHVYHPEFGSQVGDDPDRVWKPSELVAFVLDAPARFPAGKGWSYADTNYILLGMIIEKVSGHTFYEELERRVLVPLDLKDTVPADGRAIPGLVPGYSGPNSPFRKPGKTIRDGLFVINPQVEWTGGGLACTPLDLARWGRAVYTGRAFPKKLLAQVLDGVPALGGTGDRYGLGVQIWPSDRGGAVGHGGWFPGYLSRLAFYRKHKLALAIQFTTDRISNASVAQGVLHDDVAALLIEE